MNLQKKLLRSTMLVGIAVSTSAVYAQEINYMCYSDGSECTVERKIINRFEAENPGVNVSIAEVPYKAILESLPIQLAAGTGPDLAKVTDFGGLNQYYLDMTPYVDASKWASNFGDILNLYRAGPDDKGIYGMHSALTVTGAYINKTLFEQAGVAVPDGNASWDDWAEASRKVAEATETKFPMAMDRSGHRIAGPAISYGAKLFDDSGAPILVDDGFTKYVQKFVDWHNDGTMARDVWAGTGGSSYQAADKEFINGQLVYYYSGSWQVNKMNEQVGDAFDWAVVGSPCGDGGCTGMPGGAGIVAFKQTKHPEIVAKLIDFMAKQENYSEMSANTKTIPAHLGVAAAGVDYVDVSEQAGAALNAWGAQLSKITPLAYKYLGFQHNRAMWNITVQRVTQAIVGELTVEQAMDRSKTDLADVLAEIKN